MQEMKLNERFLRRLMRYAKIATHWSEQKKGHTWMSLPIDAAVSIEAYMFANILLI